MIFWERGYSTGGEWDVVILTFVRDEKMGFLSEINRLNVMWTRAKYLSIDIMNEDFFRRVSGHGAWAIQRYAKFQARNGAYCIDLRDWTKDCRRCHLPHDLIEHFPVKCPPTGYSLM